LEKLQQFLPIAEGIGHNADVFVKLFSRLDPLAAGKRSAKQGVPLKKTIEDVLEVFWKRIQRERDIYECDRSG